MYCIQSIVDIARFMAAAPPFPRSIIGKGTLREELITVVVTKEELVATVH